MSRGLQSPAARLNVEDGSRIRTRDMSAWGLSVIVHGVVLVLLSLVYFDVERRVSTLIDSAFEESDVAEYKFDSTAVDQVGGDTVVSTLTASQAAATAVVASASASPQEALESRVDESLTVSTPITGEILQPGREEMLASVQTAGGSERVSSVEGAIDRMAFEIATSLREKKTLVVWLFDVSPSLHVRREKIADRVENIYNQLNELNLGADKALKTAITTFGEKPTILTKDPLDDTDDVIKTVRGIKSEDSGKENVFGAVITATNSFLNYRTKQQRAMMLVVVTDEAGSDLDNLEKAIQLTKRYGIKCYVIGEGAPLGRQKIETEFTLESGETVIGVMDRGPESYFQQRLRLPYWGSNGFDLENIPSGFGPYALTRLCAETNGLYLIAEGAGRFAIDPIVMRSYPPDYRPIPMLETDLRTNRAKLALKEVCDQYQVENIPLPTTVFPAENDNVLRQAITEAQRPLAELDYKLDGLLQKLMAGEKDRAKITEARWRATYDLALGRVLAMRVRSYGYNMMLAEMKSSPKKFEKEGSNQWRLVPSKEITSGAATKKMANQATDYLKRVIDEHAGTPWAILAEREYATPMGWEWRENTYNPPPAMKNDGKEKARIRFIEETDPKTGKKTKRQLPEQMQRREI